MPSNDTQAVAILRSRFVSGLGVREDELREELLIADRVSGTHRQPMLAAI